MCAWNAVTCPTFRESHNALPTSARPPSLTAEPRVGYRWAGARDAASRLRRSGLLAIRVRHRPGTLHRLPRSVACKAEHDVPLGDYRTWVKYVEKGVFPDVRRFFTVLRCNHCEAAPCVEICPTTALYRRDDGIVDFDRDACIGCKACMQACPYDALYIHPDRGTAEKCNFCSHRIEVGLEPPCATVCPAEAILVGDLDDPKTRVAQIVATRKVDVRKPEKGTMPKVFYVDSEPRAWYPGPRRRPAGICGPTADREGRKRPRRLGRETFPLRRDRRRGRPSRRRPGWEAIAATRLRPGDVSGRLPRRRVLSRSLGWPRARADDVRRPARGRGAGRCPGICGRSRSPRVRSWRRHSPHGWGFPTADYSDSVFRSSGSCSSARPRWSATSSAPSGSCRSSGGRTGAPGSRAAPSSWSPSAAWARRGSWRRGPLRGAIGRRGSAGRSSPPPSRARGTAATCSRKRRARLLAESAPSFPLRRAGRGRGPGGCGAAGGHGVGGPDAGFGIAGLFSRRSPSIWSSSFSARSE